MMSFSKKQRNICSKGRGVERAGGGGEVGVGFATEGKSMGPKKKKGKKIGESVIVEEEKKYFNSL